MPLNGQLTWNDGLVTLGDDVLLGIFVDMRIRGAVRFDQADMDSQSGKQKVPMGWEDADITITLDLVCDVEQEGPPAETSDCYAKLKAINTIFKSASNNKADPKIFSVNNAHLNARGVKQVVFAGLDSYETDLDDVITVCLSFIEHNPVVIQREKQQAAKNIAQAGQGVQGATPAVKTTPAASPDIVKDNTSAYMRGFYQGLQ